MGGGWESDDGFFLFDDSAAEVYRGLLSSGVKKVEFRATNS